MLSAQVRTQRALSGDAQAQQRPVRGALLFQLRQCGGQSASRAAGFRAAACAQQQRGGQLQERLRGGEASIRQQWRCTLRAYLARRHVLAEHKGAAALPQLAQRRAGGARPGQQRRHAGVVVAAAVHGARLEAQGRGARVAQRAQRKRQSPHALLAR